MSTNTSTLTAVLQIQEPEVVKEQCRCSKHRIQRLKL